MKVTQKIQTAYDLARERYAEIGVDTEKVLPQLEQIPISIQCWQGDDVRGFENPEGDLTGGIQTSGNYPGRARSATNCALTLKLPWRRFLAKSGSIFMRFISNRTNPWSGTLLSRSISTNG